MGRNLLQVSNYVYLGFVQKLSLSCDTAVCFVQKLSLSCDTAVCFVQKLSLSCDTAVCFVQKLSLSCDSAVCFVQKLSLSCDTAVCFVQKVSVSCDTAVCFVYRIYANKCHSSNPSTSFSSCYSYAFTALPSVSFNRSAILFTQMLILTTPTFSRNLVGFT
jgi:hypothetical protein